MALELLKAAVAIIAMLGAWVAIEAAWRRTFPQRAAAKEASAGHGCHSCGDRDSCDLVSPSTTPPT